MRESRLVATPVLLFGLFYLLALFGSASIAYFNKLAGRFLLPLYIPFITLVLLSVQLLLGAARAACIRFGAPRRLSQLVRDVDRSDAVGLTYHTASGPANRMQVQAEQARTHLIRRSGAPIW